MLQHLLFVLVKLQLIQNQLIPFDQLAGSKTNRKADSLGMIFDQMTDTMQAAVNGTAMVCSVTEILPQRFFLIACDMYSMPDQLIDTLILRSRDRHDRNTKHGLHPVYIDRAPVAGDLIHHIQSNDHRDIHLQQLHAQIKVPFNIGCIHDVDDRRRLLIQNKITGYQLLRRIRRHGIDAGKIRNAGILLPPDRAILAVHRDTWEISHMLICTSQLIKQRCLAAVLIANQSKCQHRSLRQRIPRALRMELALLAKARMRRFLFTPIRVRHLRRFLDALSFYLFRVRKTQSQFIPMDPKLHRITKRCKLDHGDLSARNPSHIQKMLSQSPFAANRFDHSTLARIQILNRHVKPL